MDYYYYYQDWGKQGIWISAIQLQVKPWSVLMISSKIFQSILIPELSPTRPAAQLESSCVEGFGGGPKRRVFDFH